MDLPFVFWVYMVVVILALLSQIPGLRFASVDKYEYLEMMSFTEWKEGRVIRKELERRHKGRISGPAFYQNIARLIDEGLVEERRGVELISGIEIKTYEYRKRPGGRREKNEEIDQVVAPPVFQPA